MARAASGQERATRASLRETAGGGRRVGVVLVDHGSRKAESNAMLERFVEDYKERTGEALVEPAHMELAQPSISDAFEKCAQQGADTVVLSPFFLSPGRHWQEDLPALASDAASSLGVEWRLAHPLGTHPQLADVLFERAHDALSDLPASDAPAAAQGGTAVSSS